MRARKADGSDWLKIIWEDGSTYGRTIPTLDSATVAALVRAAHDQGMRAVAHVATRHDARAAVALGVDGLAHAPHDGPPDDDFGTLMARHGAFVAPDMRTTLESAFPLRERTRDLLTYGARATRLARDAGVPILAGTDAGNPGTAHGVTLHGELENLVNAGLTPAEALTAATAAPAEAYGLDDRGRIAPGLRADLVLVEGDPTADILSTRAIVAVWRNGAPVDREDARARVAEATAVAAAPLPIPGPVSDFDAGDLGVSFRLDDVAIY